MFSCKCCEVCSWARSGDQHETCCLWILVCLCFWTVCRVPANLCANPALSALSSVETSFRVAFLLLLFGLLAVALLSVTASTCTCFGACLLLSDQSTDLVSSA